MLKTKNLKEDRMSDVIDRPVLEQEAAANSRLRIIDCDIHPSLHARSDLNPFLPKRWQEHLKSYGDHLRTPYIGTTPPSGTGCNPTPAAPNLCGVTPSRAVSWGRVKTIYR